MKVSIGGIVNISTIDYPKKLCAVVFFCGCSFRCPFCQNWNLFKKENCERVDTNQILLALKSNFLINAVSISGGEPTLQSDGLKELLRGIKSLGLYTKIDTNGFSPNSIKKLVGDNLLDYVAMDVKAPLQPERYGQAIGLPNAGHMIVQNVRESLKFIIDSNIPLEIRTTIVPGLIDKEEDVERIAKEVQGANLYVLQQFSPERGTLDPKLNDLSPPTRSQLLKLANIAKNYLLDIRIRTKEKGEETTWINLL